MRAVAMIRKDLDGAVFEITPMGAFKGLRVMERLAKVLGPAVGAAAAGGATMLKPDAAVSAQDALDTISAALGKLTEHLDGTTFEWLARELAADTMASTEQGGMVRLLDVFDLYFAGRYGLLFAWAKAALEVNYGPLGVALLGAAGKLGASVGAAK